MAPRPRRATRPAPRRARRSAPLGALFSVALLAAGCGGAGEQVVIYTSVDQQFAAAILARFRERTGIAVQPVYDAEAGKTTGLVRRLQREAVRPRCDVWWSSEVFGTIELARQGVLEAYESPAATDVPDEWKDRGRRWTGLAARARVLCYHTGRIRAEDLPTTWDGLADRRWAARLALANPQFGTTRGHVAAIFAERGAEQAGQFLRSLRQAGAAVTDGNSMAVQAVVNGTADLCMTDTDDVWVALRRGHPLGMSYPAMRDGGDPLWIPCSVALMRGAPHPDAARRLVDFLVSSEVERALAESDARHVPVRAGLRAGLAFEAPEPRAPDFERVVDAIPAAMRAARDILLQ